MCFIQPQTKSCYCSSWEITGEPALKQVALCEQVHLVPIGHTHLQDAKIFPDVCGGHLYALLYLHHLCTQLYLLYTHAEMHRVCTGGIKS